MDKVVVFFSRCAGGTTYDNACWWGELDWGNWCHGSSGPIIAGPCETKRDVEREVHGRGYRINRGKP